MSEPDTLPSHNSLELNYRVQPTVGSLLIEKRDEGVTVTVLPSRRGIAAISLPVIGFVAVGMLVGGFSWYANGRLTLAGWIGPMLCVVGGLIHAATRIVQGGNPVVIEGDRRGISLTVRGATAVQRRTWPHADIADVRVERIATTESPFKTEWVYIQLRDGGRFALHRGTKGENAVMAAGLREGLGIVVGVDPSRFPAAARPLRVDRILLERGVVLTICPPLVWWPAIATSFALLFVPAGLAGAYIYDPVHLSIFPADERAAPQWFGVQFLIHGVSWLLISVILFKLRRHTTITLTESLFLLDERGLRPGHLSRPAKLLVDVVTKQSHPRELLLQFSTGETIGALRGESEEVVTFVSDNLRAAKMLASASPEPA